MKRYISCSRTEKFNIVHVHSLLAGFLFFREIPEGKKLRNLYENAKNLRVVRTIKNKNKTAVVNLHPSISRQFGT